MRSTGTRSTWLTASSLARAASAPIRLSYFGEQLRRAGGARPGAVLAGRYELEAPLAARTPGTLWQGRRLHPDQRADAQREQLVRLQLLDPALVEDPGMLDAFFQEACAAATIDHPNVARVIDHGVDYGLDSGVPFLVLERLVGETLADRLLAQPRLSGGELARVMGEVARGLEALHRGGVVHRRLDPEHVFLSREALCPANEALCPAGEEPAPLTQLLFAIDEVLGDNLCLVRKLSHHLSGQGWPRQGSATGGSAAGAHGRQGGSGRARLETAEYQSPEQLLGHDPIDERCDLWSLAVIAFEAATGTPAFSGSSLGDRLVQICSGEPNLVPADLPLPPGFASWFQKGVRKLPAERFASAREMADALQSILHPR